MIKACSKCKEELPYTAKYFSLDHRNQSGLAGQCRPCTNKRTRIWAKNNRERASANTRRYRQRNPEKTRKQSLKRVGFTPELYDYMFKEQDGKCALCGTTKFDGLNKVLNSDHDHKTGKPRGLLCWTCNSVLGKIELKGVDWLDKAKKYINEGGFYNPDLT